MVVHQLSCIENIYALSIRKPLRECVQLQRHWQAPATSELAHCEPSEYYQSSSVLKDNRTLQCGGAIVADAHVCMTLCCLPSAAKCHARLVEHSHPQRYHLFLKGAMQLPRSKHFSHKRRRCMALCGMLLRLMSGTCSSRWAGWTGSQGAATLLSTQPHIAVGSNC